MAADKQSLTVENFIMRIKEMDDRERKKIRLQDLIDIILLLPDNFNIKEVEKIKTLEETIANLVASVENIRSQSVQNAAEIINLNSRNNDLETQNEQILSDIHILKQNEEFEKFDEDIREINHHINSIEQYLRVNNLEIVGLPEPGVNESNEDIIIEALNTLNDLENKLSSADIDISHPIPSKRRDKKRVSVVRFLSRKSKFDVLAAKKQMRNFKFRNNEVFINEHLSPDNRTLFALAAEKKKALNYKYLWTKNGVTFMRQHERSEIFTISSNEDLDKLCRDED